MKIFAHVKREVSLVKLLHDRIPEQNEPLSLESVHASDLTNENAPFCPREFALLRATGKKRKGFYISVALRHTFNMGWDIQRRVNNEYLRDVMWGTWRCPRCYVDHHAQLVPEKCASCGVSGGLLEYVESRVQCPGHNLSGGLDACVQFAPNDIRLVEIKSVDKDIAKKLKAPLSEHRIRTRLYLYLASKTPELSAALNTSVAHILYISKSFGFRQDTHGQRFSPFMEYRIERNDAEIAPYLQKAAALEKAMKSKSMPHGICSGSACKRAQSCSVVAECFGGQYPWQVPI